ncbi:uncharacterized protein C3orf14 homolog [Hippoglossus hippoglossus]|uniref:uncharacterized protein C3orf14 homolog n=1 Tax=Hippoglossus hippoglossus TaxID=8267 RepID=UPI00148B5FEA|nr:uncharacterized protein C3orf14 homolog [Hippoglossus hippoglossus]
MDLLEKHEDILGKRAELLEEMGSRREQLNILRRQQVEEREAARHRNATLLQDLQKIEDGLRGGKLTHPNLLALEIRAAAEPCAWWRCLRLPSDPVRAYSVHLNRTSLLELM